MGDGIRVKRDVFAHERQLVGESEGAVARARIIDGVLLQIRRIAEGEEAFQECVKRDGLFAWCEDVGYRVDTAMSSSSPDNGALEAEVKVLRRLEREAEGVGPRSVRRRVTLQWTDHELITQRPH